MGARRAVRAQKIGARRARCVRKKYFFSFEFVQVRAFAGARGENIFLVEAFSRAFWRTDGGRRTDAVFVRLTGGKAQVRLRSASPS